MGTEHAQYFEVHPVKAYYVLGRNSRGAIEIFDSAAEQAESGTWSIKIPLVKKKITLTASTFITIMPALRSTRRPVSHTKGSSSELPSLIQLNSPTALA